VKTQLKLENAGGKRPERGKEIQYLTKTCFRILAKHNGS